MTHLKPMPEELTESLVDLRAEMDVVFEQTYKQILAQREEILTAFIAKYGCHPDEIEQVEEHFEHGRLIRWYVRKRDPTEFIAHR